MQQNSEVHSYILLWWEYLPIPYLLFQRLWREDWQLKSFGTSHFICGETTWDSFWVGNEGKQVYNKLWKHNQLLTNKATRENLVDHRQDVCVYLISPSGHGAKKYDLECLRRLQVNTRSKVNSSIINISRALCQLCLALQSQTASLMRN